MAKVKLSVSVDDKELHRFSDVVKNIKKAGMKVNQRLDEIGIVTGEIDDKKMGALHGVKGVAGVEEEKEFNIGPPDKGIS